LKIVAIRLAGSGIVGFSNDLARVIHRIRLGIFTAQGSCQIAKPLIDPGKGT
jgi:hypothetical protein